MLWKKQKKRAKWALFWCCLIWCCFKRCIPDWWRSQHPFCIHEQSRNLRWCSVCFRFPVLFCNLDSKCCLSTISLQFFWKWYSSKQNPVCWMTFRRCGQFLRNPPHKFGLHKHCKPNSSSFSNPCWCRNHISNPSWSTSPKHLAVFGWCCFPIRFLVFWCQL